MEMLKIGIIGGGNIGNDMLTALSGNTKAYAAAICDIDETAAKTLAERHGVESVYTDWKDVVARDDISMVFLPLPDQLHAEVAIAAMRSGKHVLCEKPMALDLQECKDMIRVSRETGMKLMVGQVGRFAPAFVEAKRLYDEGAIGEMFMIESEYAHDYSQTGGKEWRAKPEREPIIGGGCHAIDLIRTIAGNPIEVFGYANNKSLTDWPIHDCTMAVMKLPNDVIGKVMTSIGCKRKYTMRTCVYGTKGTLIFDNTSTTMSLFKEEFSDDKAFEGMSQKTIEIKLPIRANSHNFKAELESFIDCVVEDKEVVATGEEGASTVAVAVAIVESFKTGEKVTVDYNF